MQRGVQIGSMTSKAMAENGTGNQSKKSKKPIISFKSISVLMGPWDRDRGGLYLIDIEQEHGVGMRCCNFDDPTWKTL